jgi:hypothetical protein
VVKEGRAFKPINSSAGGFHTIGHSRWATGEHTNLRQQDVLLLKVVKELVEVWAAKVSDGAETSEQTLAGQPLEVTFTDVLQ